MGVKMNPLEDWQNDLAQHARLVMERAYAPYSRFQVGAALLSQCGTIVTGCNVENCSYGLTICAERNAATSAVTQGLMRWKAIAIATIGGVAPCGACRQFLAEFTPDMLVILIDASYKTDPTIMSLAELLPHSFSPAKLNDYRSQP